MRWLRLGFNGICGFMIWQSCDEEPTLLITSDIIAHTSQTFHKLLM